MLVKKLPSRNGRITARVPENIFILLNQAAEILGSTINQFLIQAALEKAETIMKQELIINLSKEDTQLFFEILENPPELNKKMQAAINKYKESELYDTSGSTEF